MAFDDATGTIEVSPKFDLAIATDHAVIGDDAPVYDVTRVLLTGGLRSVTDSNQLEVLGALSLDTNPDGFGFSATPRPASSTPRGRWELATRRCR